MHKSGILKIIIQNNESGNSITLPDFQTLQFLLNGQSSTVQNCTSQDPQLAFSIIAKQKPENGIIFVRAVIFMV